MHSASNIRGPVHCSLQAPCKCQAASHVSHLQAPLPWSPQAHPQALIWRHLHCRDRGTHVSGSVRQLIRTGMLLECRQRGARPSLL